MSRMAKVQGWKSSCPKSIRCQNVDGHTPDNLLQVLALEEEEHPSLAFTCTEEKEQKFVGEGDGADLDNAPR